MVTSHKESHLQITFTANTLQYRYCDNEYEVTKCILKLVVSISMLGSAF